MQKHYLATMEAALGRLDEARRREIVAEISDHLEDKARWLMLRGLPEEASMEKAMEAFGDPAEVGRELKQVHGQGTWGEALATMLPFLAIGLVALGPYLPQPASIVASYTALLIGFGVPLIGLGVGWVKGFPRWSYAYGGLVLAVTSLLLANNLDLWIFNRYDTWVTLFRHFPVLADVVFYLMFSKYNMWMLFLAMAVIALLLSRLWRPLRPLYQGVWHDWTRLSFGLYGVVPLVLVMAFDEVSPTFRAPYLVASTVVLTVGALAYVRSARTSQRTLALLIGMTLSWAVTTVGAASFWHAATWDMLRDWVVLATLMFGPALLGLLRRSAKFIRAA